MTDEESYALIERYLEKNADAHCKEDGRVSAHYKLGAAIAVLNALLLARGEDERIARKLFKRWLAENAKAPEDGR